MTTDLDRLRNRYRLDDTPEARLVWKLLDDHERLIERVKEAERAIEDTDELCEECDRNLLKHDAPERFDTWWMCGVCANKRSTRLRAAEKVVRLARKHVDNMVRPLVHHDLRVAVAAYDEAVERVKE